MPAATLKRVPSLAQKDLLDIQQLLKQAHARANEIEAEGQSVRPALDALEGQVTAAAAQLAAASAAPAARVPPVLPVRRLLGCRFIGYWLLNCR